MRFNLFRGQDVVVEKELAHEFGAIVRPEVSELVERLSELRHFEEDERDALHQLSSLLRQILDFFDVRLQADDTCRLVR